MNPIELKNKLHSGEYVFGTLIVSPSPFWPKIIKNSLLDFVFIDTEHIAIDSSELSWMCRLYSELQIPPLVRITSPNPYDATMVLDYGAEGVIAPYIESAEEVTKLRGATKLRPLKGKKLDKILEGGEIEQSLKEYLDDFNKKHILIVNIESLPALNNLDEILDVPGLDAVLIGSHDLSCSLGVPEQYENKIFLDAAETIFKKARLKKIGAGIHSWCEIDHHVRLLNMGANMLIHKADIILFESHLKKELKQIRQKLKIEENTKIKKNEINI